MSTVDPSIKTRLLTREDPFLREVSLTGVAAATVKFLNTATKTYEDKEEKKRLCQKLAFDALARIEEYKQEVKYVDHTSNAVDKELAKCNEIHEDFEKTIDETKREVESLKLKLREEQKRRAEREECETLGKQINTFP
eukprot:g1251.t1